uniref:Uncharacterized protein n=1 Tax=Timema poppense TaxID=170557 RepID=A0A7R9D9V9_TIMPO|nr:unnamed protein product [Timema poppensis]
MPKKRGRKKKIPEGLESTLVCLQLIKDITMQVQATISSCRELKPGSLAQKADMQGMDAVSVLSTVWWINASPRLVQQGIQQERLMHNKQEEQNIALRCTGIR